MKKKPEARSPETDMWIKPEDRIPFSGISCLPRHILPVLLLAGCGKPATFEYQGFRYEPPDFSYGANEYVATFVRIDASYQLPVRVDSPTEVLNWVGGFGWRFVSGDGTNFIVERQRGQCRDGSFAVTRAMVTAHNPAEPKD